MTVNVSAELDAVPPLLSSIATVTEEVPSVEGVQEIWAEELGLHPAGRPDQVKVYAPEPPVASAVNVTEWPRSTVEGEALGDATAGSVSTVNESGALVALPPRESTTVAVTEKSPAAEGAQLSWVTELEVHPVGSPDQEYVYDPEPPLADVENVTEDPRSIEELGLTVGTLIEGPETTEKERPALATE